MNETNLSAWLNPTMLAATERLRQSFADARPFPHVVIEDFFSTMRVEQLLGQFPAFERGNSISDDGRSGPKATFDRIHKLGAAYGQLDQLIQGKAFLSWLSEVTGIPELLYDPWYLGGGTHENRDGASLDAHVDFNYHPSERWHRRLNLIVYLNPVWEAAWGGALELYRDPSADNRPTQLIAPLYNRCVIFETSEVSWHGFTPIVLPDTHKDVTRRSVALYFYSREREQRQTTGRHSTVYVQRPLPERLQEGSVLTRSDLAELKQLLETRDAHMRYLYAENARLLQAQDKGLTGQLLYLAKRAYVRFRR